MCAAGDENGDGFGDVVVGWPTFSSNDGRVLFYHGAGDMPSTQPGWTSTVADTSFGSFFHLGDVNGDGYDEACRHQWDPEQNAIYVGGPGGIAASPTWVFSPASLNPVATEMVPMTGLGDINGDGYDDVRATAFQGSQAWHYLLYGGASGLGTPLWWSSNDYGPYAAGDVNGDGYADLLVQTPPDLFLGGPGGPGTTPVWTLPNTWAGVGVDDTDGDGFGDVLVYDYNLPNQYRVGLYKGEPDGIATSPSATFVVPRSSNYSGGVGDLNGDGLADFEIGDWATTVLGGTGTLTIHYGNDALPPTSLVASSTGPAPPKILRGVCIGDVNHDGFDDLYVSGDQAYWYIYLGSPAGLDTVPAFSASLKGVAVLLQRGADVNGDGFADVLVGYSVAGTDYAYVYYGNSAITGAPGLDRIPQQRRASDTAPIGLQGISDQAAQFRLAARGRSAAGRTRVRMETDVKNWGVPFESNLGNLIHDPWSKTGAPGANGSFVALDAPRTLPNVGPTDKWRMRIAAHTPYFPWTPWLSPVGTGRNQYDLRNASSAAVVSVPVAHGTPAPLQLVAPSPNPSRGATRLAFSLPTRATVDLAVYDLAGRRVATLASGEAQPGPHQAVWDGCETSGRLAGSGVYFVRLDAAGRRVTQKLVRMQ